MGKTILLDKIPVFGKRIILTALVVILLSSCEAVAPVLINAAIKFGQDLLSVSAHNVSPQYASDIERLLVALMQEQTGAKIPQGQGQYGYGGNTQGQYGYGSNTQQDQYGYGSNTQQDQYGYGSNTQQDQYGSGSNTQQDQYGYGSNTQQDQYGYGGGTQDQYQPRYRSIHPPISMDVALLAQKIQSDGSVMLEAIQDGTVLRDGRGNPEAGDKLKISFKANCNCYVYVIGIDATGFVAEVFPDPDSSIGNPVSADRQYTFPEGDIWWGLDDYRGVETVYFIASHTRRTDIEEIISSMANTTRRVPKDYKVVQVAAVIPDTRGLVKVHSAQASKVMTEAGSTFEYTPTAFTTAVSGVDLVITRWFLHQ